MQGLQGEKKRARRVSRVAIGEDRIKQREPRISHTAHTYARSSIEDILARGDGSLMIERDETELVHQ